MFELDVRGSEPRDDFVEQARAARAAGKVCFQVYLPGGAEEVPAQDWLVDYQTAGVVEALEAEGWTLENVAPVREPEGEPWARISTIVGPAVGMIYTFRST